MTVPRDQFFRVGVRNTTFTTVGHLSNAIISLIFAGLTIRYLGLPRAGFLMALQAVLGINGVMGDFGLSVPLSRRLAFLIFHRRFQYARLMLGTIITTTSVSSILFGILIVVTFPWIVHYSRLEPMFHADAWGATVLTALQFVLQQPSNALRSAYTSCQRYDVYHGTSIVLNLASNLLRLAALLFWPTMTAVAAAGLVATIVTILFDSVWLRFLLHGLTYPALLWREVRQALGFGAWNWGSKLGQFCYGSADRIILTAFLGAGALPLYAFPQRFVEQIHGLLSGQLHYLFPYFSALGEDSAAIIQQVEDRMRWMLALIAVVLYGGIALFGQPLLTVLVGTEFAEHALLPLQLACIQGVFMAQVIFNYYATWSQNEAKVNALYDLTTYAGSCLLALMLIPSFGVTGAALAKLVVVPLFFYHLYHSRLCLRLDCSIGAMLSPYALPLMLLAYLVISQCLLSTFVTDWRWQAVLASFLIPLGCVGVWSIETQFFREYHRAEMLTRLAASAWTWCKCLGTRHPA